MIEGGRAELTVRDPKPRIAVLFHRFGSAVFLRTPSLAGGRGMTLWLDAWELLTQD